MYICDDWSETCVVNSIVMKSDCRSRRVETRRGNGAACVMLQTSLHPASVTAVRSNSVSVVSVNHRTQEREVFDRRKRSTYTPKIRLKKKIEKTACSAFPPSPFQAVRFGGFLNSRFHTQHINVRQYCLVPCNMWVQVMWPSSRKW